MLSLHADATEHIFKLDALVGRRHLNIAPNVLPSNFRMFAINDQPAFQIDTGNPPVAVGEIDTTLELSQVDWTVGVFNLGLAADGFHLDGTIFVLDAAIAC